MPVLSIQHQFTWFTICCSCGHSGESPTTIVWLLESGSFPLYWTLNIYIFIYNHWEEALKVYKLLLWIMADIFLSFPPNVTQSILFFFMFKICIGKTAFMCRWLTSFNWHEEGDFSLICVWNADPNRQVETAINYSWDFSHLSLQELSFCP